MVQKYVSTYFNHSAYFSLHGQPFLLEHVPNQIRVDYFLLLTLFVMIDLFSRIAAAADGAVIAL